LPRKNMQKIPIIFYQYQASSFLQAKQHVQMDNNQAMQYNGDILVNERSNFVPINKQK